MDRSTARGWLVRAAVVPIVLLHAGLVPGAAGALQAQARVESEVFADSELERYLRVLQNGGAVGEYPWSIRGFSGLEVKALVAELEDHPWAARYAFAPMEPEGLSIGLIRPSAGAVFNTAFPQGGEGVVWAGKGLTTVLQGGVHALYGPVSIVLAPIVFRAENGEFPLRATGSAGAGEYWNPITPQYIDLPQRFGGASYTRIDPGNSSVRVEAFGAVAGLSTASQAWGPAGTNSLVLGTNAGGFPHAFLGTAVPLNIGIGKVHARLSAGRLEESDYSPAPEEEGRRVMNGLIAVFQPWGLNGLELGFGRFYHRLWPDDGIRGLNILRPLESLLKEGVPDADQRDPDNQLASLFFRWNFPADGFELMGEYMREDHSFDLRTFILEPDDLRAYFVGFQKAWATQGDEIVTLRGEVMNAESTHRARSGSRVGTRTRYALYQHAWIRQGHTHRGQLLAAPYGHGGAASLLAVDRYDETGRISLEWERGMRGDQTDANGGPSPGYTDVVHSLALSVFRFVGPVDVSGSVRGMYNLNRDLASDVFNLNVQLGGTFNF